MAYVVQHMRNQQKKTIHPTTNAENKCATKAWITVTLLDCSKWKVTLHNPEYEKQKVF